MTHPVLPVDAGELAALVARLWPQVARAHEVDPDGYQMGTVDGRLESWATHGGLPGYTGAIEALVTALEDLGLEVEGLGHDRRVLGWAAVEALPAPQLVRLIDLEAESPWCSRVQRWRDRLAAERAGRVG